MTARRDDIDLAFRPTSYFWASAYGIPLVSDMKGASRRFFYQNALEEGLTEYIPDALTQHALPEDARRKQGAIHPSLMGGEYLPDRRSHEIEIARITIASVTYDVTAVYASSDGQRIAYRVVDDYDGETLSDESTTASETPLSLLELVDFFLGAWDLISVLAMNFEYDNYPREQVHDFIVDASSDFYSDFGRLVTLKVDEWLDTLPVAEEKQGVHGK